MNRVSSSVAGSGCLNLYQSNLKSPPGDVESDFDRVVRLYKSPGGVLIGWLEDDANKRGHDFKELAEALGVTMGYMLQLQRGIRRVQDITHDFCASCATYLGVPTIAVKLVAGVIRVTDFLNPAQTEEEVIERAIRKMQDDPVIRQAVPMDLTAMPLDAKKALVLMYTETSMQDVLGLSELPSIVHWCQKAAVLHDERQRDLMARNEEVPAG